MNIKKEDKKISKQLPISNRWKSDDFKIIKLRKKKDKGK